MAKQAQLVKQEGGPPPANPDDLDALLREHAGEGVSTDAADNLVPQIRVLQPLSPEVTAGKAAAGDFQLPDRVIKGSEGLWFQPCWRDNIWLEFTPRDRGGGFVGAHAFSGFDPSGNAIAPQGSRRQGAFGHVMAATGNDVAHYSQWSGLMWDAPGRALEHVINFSKSGHTIQKKWNTKALQADRFPDGRSQALFAHVYHLTTYQTRNAKGTWYLIEVGPAVLIKSPEAAEVVGDQLQALRVAIALASAFKNREKVAAQDVGGDASVDDSEVM